jgi:microcystin-dependent protein
MVGQPHGILNARGLHMNESLLKRYTIPGTGIPGSNQDETSRIGTRDKYMRARNARLAAASVLLLCGSLGLAQPAKAQASDPFIGEIIYVGFTFCPRGWAEANGQLLPISQNTALFSLLGTTYGGDGRTTFALPDLRGRVPVHLGQGAGLSDIQQGEVAGTESRTLTFAQMPSHTHTATTTVADIEVTSSLRGSATAANTKSPVGNALAISKQPTYTSSSPATDMAAGSVQSTVTGGNATTTVDATNSGASPVPVRDPYLGLRACIALQGVFPSRD